MAIPTLVQYLNEDSYPGPGGDGTVAATVFTVNLLMPTLSSNCLVAAVTYRSGNTVTITDNKGNSWGSPLATANDGAIVLGVWVLPNCLAGTQLITLTLSAHVDNESVLKPYFSEWCNVATSSPSDATPSTTTAATLPTVSSGSFTPGTNGSLILNFARDSAGGVGQPRTVAANFLTGITAGTNFTLIGAGDRMHAMTAEYYVQPTAGAINPSVTMSGANGDTALSISIALKSASAGTPPSGIRFVGLSRVWCDGSAEPNPQRELSSFGNLIVVASDDFTVDPVNAVSDSINGAYTRAPDTAPDLTRTSQIFYRGNAVPSAVNVITITKPTWQTLFEIFDIAGAAGDPFNTSAAAHDDVTAGPDTCSGGTITPTVTGCLLVCRATLGKGPTASINIGDFIGLNYTGRTDGGPGEGNGLMTQRNAAVSANVLVWTTNTALDSTVGTTTVAFNPPITVPLSRFPPLSGMPLQQQMDDLP